MRSWLRAYAEKIVEAGWLAALIVAPLFFNPYSERVFNLSNVALVRSLAVLMLAAWLIVQVESPTSRVIAARLRLRWGRWPRDNPLALPTFALVGSCVVSTLTSIAPTTSLLGSYAREQGLYTTCSYIVIFFLAATTIRTYAQVARALNVALVVSFPIAFYGVIQHYALDPLSWPREASPERVTSTIGNPAFLGAYLIMVIPFTLMRLAAQTERVSSQLASPRARAWLYGAVVVSCIGLAAAWGTSFDPGAISLIATGSIRAPTREMLNVALAQFNLRLALSALVLLGWCLAGMAMRRSVGNTLLVGVYALLLAIQAVALWFTQSRGPFVGLLSGLVIFMVLSALLRGARRIALSVLGAILVLFSFISLSSSGAAAPLLGLRDPSMIRLARTFSIEGGTTAQVRALIWQGAWQLALPHAPLWSPTTGEDSLNWLRPLIGYGPESMYAAYPQFYPPELARIELRTAKLDRAHNETLDSLVQTGLLGVAAQVLLFSSICYAGCKWLGLLPIARARNAFIALWLAGGVGMALLVGLTFGWYFLGVALPAGMLSGLFVYLFAVGYRSGWAKIARAPQPNRSSMRDALLMALIAALIGHWVEIQFGVAVTPTRVYFWFLAGLLVAVGVRHVCDQDPSAAAPMRNGGHISTAPLVVFALFTGLILAVLAFDFVSIQNASWSADGATRALDMILAALTSKATTDGPQPSLAIVWLLVGTVLLAVAIGVLEWGRSLPLQPGEWLMAIGLVLLTALAVFSAFVFCQSFLIEMSAPGGLSALASAFPYSMLFVIAVVLIGAAGLVREQSLPRSAPLRPGSWMAGAAAIVAAIVLVGSTNVAVVQADSIDKQAAHFTIAGTSAVGSLQQALAIQPARDYLLVFLSNAYLAQARELSDVADRQELLVRAEAALFHARAIAPFDSDHTLQLAQLHQAWAELAMFPAEKSAHMRQALAYYAQAMRPSPNAAHLNDQYAQLLLQAAAVFAEQHDLSAATQARREAEEQLARALALDPSFCLTFAIRAGTLRRWEAMADDALKALTYVPLCRLHRDPFEQQARTLALQSLSAAGERAGAAGQGAAFAAMLEAKARAHSSVDLYMALADYYAKQGTLDAAIQAAELGGGLIAADDQAGRQKYAYLLDSLRVLREARGR